MIPFERWQLAFQAIGVLATIIIAVLAVWGEGLRALLSGPVLKVSLRSPDGERTSWTGNVPTRFYHLSVSNERPSEQAKAVRLVLTKLARFAANQWWAIPLSGPLQLTWQFPQTSPQFPTIGPEHTCDLGFVVQRGDFRFSLYAEPNNFQGTVKPGSSVRAELRAAAENGQSEPLCLEIAWDGVWSEDNVEMRRHLVVKTVASADGV